MCVIKIRSENCLFILHVSVKHSNYSNVMYYLEKEWFIAVNISKHFLKLFIN